MTMFGAKFLAAASVEKQKEQMKAQMMEELQDKLKLEALESVLRDCYRVCIMVFLGYLVFGSPICTITTLSVIDIHEST